MGDARKAFRIVSRRDSAWNEGFDGAVVGQFDQGARACRAARRAVAASRCGRRGGARQPQVLALTMISRQGPRRASPSHSHSKVSPFHSPPRLGAAAELRRTGLLLPPSGPGPATSNPPPIGQNQGSGSPTHTGLPGLRRHGRAALQPAAAHGRPAPPSPSWHPAAASLPAALCARSHWPCKAKICHSPLRADRSEGCCCTCAAWRLRRAMSVSGDAWVNSCHPFRGG